jgi:hypothetical protein
MNPTEFDKLVAAHDFCMAQVEKQMAIMDKESRGIFSKIIPSVKYKTAERLAKEYLDRGQKILDQIYGGLE